MKLTYKDVVVEGTIEEIKDFYVNTINKPAVNVYKLNTNLRHWNDINKEWKSVSENFII